MKAFKWLFLVIAAYVLAFVSVYGLLNQRNASSSETGSSNFSPIVVEAKTTTPRPGSTRYHLDARASKFMANAERSGLLWFKGHSHHIAVREFTGEAVL